MRFILRHAKFVIANSRFTASLLREEGIVKVEIIQPAVSIPTSVTPLNNGVHGRPDNVDPDPYRGTGHAFPIRIVGMTIVTASSRSDASSRARGLIL